MALSDPKVVAILGGTFLFGVVLQFLVREGAWIATQITWGLAPPARASPSNTARRPAPPPTPQGCALWHNWWPMLSAFVYVLVPMPWLFFGSGGGAYGGSNLASGWADAGKFLTGFSAVGALAVPQVLYHAGKIAGGAMVVELLAVMVMGGSLVAYEALSESESGGFYS